MHGTELIMLYYVNEFNSGELFLMLSANLGHEWKSFERYLGLKSAAIENIEADHLSQNGTKFHVFIQWTRQGTASRTALHNAILVGHSWTFDRWLVVRLYIIYAFLKSIVCAFCLYQLDCVC